MHMWSESRGNYTLITLNLTIATVIIAIVTKSKNGLRTALGTIVKKFKYSLSSRSPKT